MKRILLIFLGFVVCVAALFALLILFLPREGLKTRIGEQVAAWTGREVSLRGEPEISVFPRLSVTLNDVHVAGPEDMADAEILSMDRLTGTIRLLPLLIGRVEIGSFTMVRPLVRLVRDEHGRRNWAFDTGAAALQLAFAGDVPLGNFRLEGGTIRFEDRKTGADERIDSVNVTVDWASVRKPVAVEGSGIWRGEEMTLSAGAEAPFAFMNGAATPFNARIESAPIEMIFNGEARDSPSPTLSGTLKLAAPSLRRFASWLGSPIGPGSTLGQASIFGTASFAKNVLSVDSAEMTLDGNAASGALKVEVRKVPDISGTLAFSTLNLSPYFAGLSSALAAADDWRTVKIPTDWFGSFNADIRLSADSVKLGELVTGNTAASVSLRDRRLEIGLARAVLDGGGLSGNLAITDSRAADEASAEMQVRATEMTFSGAAPLIGFEQEVSGTASAALDVTTSGGDLGTLVSRLGGSGQLSIRDGAVPLFGVADIAGGKSAADASASALTPVPIQSITLGTSFANGSAMLNQADIVTPSYAATLQGSIGLLDGSLRLTGAIKNGAATRTGDTGAATDGSANEGRTFSVEGTLSEPAVQPLALAN